MRARDAAGAEPSSEDLGALRGALGEDAVDQHAPVDVDGCPVGVTLRPPNAESLAAVLAVLSERGLPALVRGSGTTLFLGNPPTAPALFVCTEELAGVEELDADDGVARVRAGTRLSELRAQARAQGWEVPLDPPGEARTVGGVLASAAMGPRRLGFGGARDCVLGLDVALASGRRTRCGGRVVKNVTGYDLPKLYTGSFGTLGVIEAAWLRLHPLPECVSEVAIPLEPGPRAFELGLEAARRPSARATALLTPRLARRVAPDLASESRWLLVAEFAGDERTSSHDAAWLEAQKGASSLRHSDAVAGGQNRGLTRDLRALQGACGEPRGIRARVALRPSLLERGCALLLGAGAELLSYPGLGLAYACFELEADSAESGSGQADAALSAVERVVSGEEGSWLFEELPAWAKPERDVFGFPPAALPLMRRLKERFDPRGVLNRGRFCGGM